MLKHLLLVAALLSPAHAATPTFYQDILPLLEKHCLACHHPAGIAPMAFDTYESTRPWAKAIQRAVASRRMPPWLADQAVGHFRNQRWLTQSEIDAISSWALNSAAPPGRRRFAHLPEPAVLNSKPGLELALPNPIAIPAKGELEYQYVVLPHRFEKETWIQAAEIRPGVASVVHHAVVYIRPQGDTWGSTKATHGPTTNDILAIYTPGMGPAKFPRGTGKRIPAGADLLIQLHYTPDGRPHRDRTVIALQFAAQPPAKAILTLQLNNTNFLIPAGEGNHRVTATGTLPHDAELISLFPHMHLRGKAFEYAIVGEGGFYEPLLRVPRYDFHWQFNYELLEPRLLKAGTRLQATGWFDNSRNNPRNPDPTADVRYGEPSTAEMMIGFFDVAVPANVTKQSFFPRGSDPAP